MNIPTTNGMMGNYQMQIILRACHGNVKETALFLDFCGRACGKIRRQTAIYDI